VELFSTVAAISARVGVVRDRLRLNHLSAMRHRDLNRQGHTKPDHNQDHQDSEKIRASIDMMSVHCHTNSFNQLN
jgi:hypothetical protein